MPAFYAREYLHRLLPMTLHGLAIVLACPACIMSLNQQFGMAGYYLGCAITSIVLVAFAVTTYYRILTKPMPRPGEPFHSYQQRLARGLYRRADILDATANTLCHIQALEHFIVRLNNHAEIYRFTADAIAALEQA